MLALWVMIFHLLSIPVIGPYAVLSFYSLSGFLMTTIMHESYGYDRGGVRRYAANRFLRLYPMYWAAAIISIIAIAYVTPEFSKTYKNILYIPDSFKNALFNITLVFPDQDSPRLCPPTWALTVEIFYYACIGFGLSRTKRLTLIWVGLSFIYYFLTYLGFMGLRDRYFTILAGSLPFSLGSLTYFYKDEIYSFLLRFKISNPIFILALYILTTAVFTFNEYYRPFPNFHWYLGEIGRYWSQFFTLLVIVSLYFRGNEIFSKRIDKFIGDYSYPIYVLHWQLALLASFIVFKTPTRGLSIDGLLVFLVALLFVFVVSSILINTIDRSVSLIRKKIKSKGIHQSNRERDELEPQRDFPLGFIREEN